MEECNQDLYIAGVFKQLSELSSSLKDRYDMALGRKKMLGDLSKAFSQEKFTNMASEGLDDIINSVTAIRRRADVSLQQINTYIDELLRDALNGEEHRCWIPPVEKINKRVEITLTDMRMILEEGLVSDVYDFSRYYVDALDGVALVEIVLTYEKQIRTPLHHLLERSRCSIASDLAFEIVVRLVILTFDSDPDGVEFEEDESPGRVFDRYMMTCLYKMINNFEPLKTIGRSYSDAAIMWRELVMNIQTSHRPSGYTTLEVLWDHVHTIGRQAAMELRHRIMLLVPSYLHLPEELLDMIHQYLLGLEGIPSEYASSVEQHYRTIEYYNAYLNSHPTEFQNPRTQRLQKRRVLPDVSINLN